MSQNDIVASFVDHHLDAFKQATLQIHAQPKTSDHEFFARAALATGRSFIFDTYENKLENTIRLCESDDAYACHLASFRKTLEEKPQYEGYAIRLCPLFNP